MRTKLLAAVGFLVITGAIAGFVVWRRTTASQAPKPAGATIAAPTKGAVIGQRLPGTRIPSQFPGGIEVTLNGDAEMLLTDPSGRRTGFDPVSNSPIAEIPDASAGDDSIDDPTDNSDSPINIRAKTVEISPTVAGTYSLMVSSATKGTYDLALGALSSKFQGSRFDLSNVQIEAGARHVYVLRSRADVANSGNLELSGGFGGTGGPREKVERMLTYASPIASETNLPSETRLFSLLVFYDSRAHSDSFSAAIDGRQITSMFHPTPGGFEKVDIPLHPGRNEVVLSLSGSLWGGEASTDHDCLEFVVAQADQAGK